MKKTILAIALLALTALFSTNTVNAQTTDKDVIIIELTQTTGEFFTKELTLKPGKYQFRVVNQNVDKDLGFVIQKAEDAKGDVMETAVHNSFTTALVKKGEVQYTGIVALEKGKYVYSCPLNPTPHYTIMVE